MENYNLVRPEHLNHHGSLFGGQLLSWVDECAWMAAARDFPNCTFVTRAMDRIEFKHQVKNGSILRLLSIIDLYIFDCSTARSLLYRKTEIPIVRKSAIGMARNHP